MGATAGRTAVGADAVTGTVIAVDAAMKTKARGLAVVLVDTINGFDFEGSGELVRAAERAAERIEALARRARAAGVPVIYVNDNFGRWRSDFRATIEACTAPGQPGREVSRRLRPEPDDYFVLKPMHSAFYATPFELLLDHLEIGTLILTGFAADLCVLFTAHDAHMRGLRLVVPSDCTAANSPSITDRALLHLREALSASIEPSTSIDL
jgi:nicotinamidase-related amidase